MSDHVVILVLAVAGLVVFLIYKGALRARTAREERVRALRALGFEPLDSPPPETSEAMLSLHGKNKRISNVFERGGSSDRVYVYDLQDRSGESTRREVIAIFSPRLQLPRLTIFPRIAGEGRLAALGNLVLTKLAQRHGATVDLGFHPRFSERHYVIGPDEDALRRFLTTDRLDRLAAMEHMMVDGEGEAFAYQRVRYGTQGKESADDEVAGRVQEAEELLRAFTRF